MRIKLSDEALEAIRLIKAKTYFDDSDLIWDFMCSGKAHCEGVVKCMCAWIDGDSAYHPSLHPDDELPLSEFIIERGRQAKWLP